MQAAVGSFRGAANDDALVSALLEREPEVIAIDAPLTLPHAITCRRTGCKRCRLATRDGRYSARRIDTKDPWEAQGFGVWPPFVMVMLAGIAFRAIYLARALGESGIRVVETWPGGVYAALSGPDFRSRRRLDVETRRSLLDDVVGGLDLAWARDDAGRPDRLDAVAAGYAAWCIDAGEAAEICDPDFRDEGSIFVPPIRD